MRGRVSWVCRAAGRNGSAQMKQQMGGGEWVWRVGPLETLEEGCNHLGGLCGACAGPHQRSAAGNNAKGATPVRWLASTGLLEHQPQGSAGSHRSRRSRRSHRSILGLPPTATGRRPWVRLEPVCWPLVGRADGATLTVLTARYCQPHQPYGV